jgi:hypothetical protein
MGRTAAGFGFDFFYEFIARTNTQAITAKISNTKHQIPNKSQITIIYLEFDICDLEFPVYPGQVFSI